MPSCIFSSAYLAPISYYTYLYHSKENWVEVCDSYMKQTYRNRMEISSPNGKIALTIPIEKPLKGSTMKDIRIAHYGHWNHLHWQALASAYGKSPFFEYYADDYAPIFASPNNFLVDFNEILMRTTLRLLYMDKTIQRTEEYLPSYPTDCIDLRGKIHPKKDIEKELKGFHSLPYYQVFREKNGFIPNLSIIDLLFNMGTESILFLRDGLKLL